MSMNRTVTGGYLRGDVIALGPGWAAMETDGKLTRYAPGTPSAASVVLTRNKRRPRTRFGRAPTRPLRLPALCPRRLPRSGLVKRRSRRRRDCRAPGRGGGHYFAGSTPMMLMGNDFSCCEFCKNPVICKTSSTVAEDQMSVVHGGALNEPVTTT